MVTDAELIGYMYDALRSPCGIYLTTPSPEKLRARLYQLRAQELDENLKHISFVISPIDPRQLWLVKRINEYVED